MPTYAEQTMPPTETSVEMKMYTIRCFCAAGAEAVAVAAVKLAKLLWHCRAHTVPRGYTRTHTYLIIFKFRTM